MLGNTIFYNKVGNNFVGVVLATEAVKDGLKKLNTSTEHFDKKFPNNVAVKQALDLLDEMDTNIKSLASQLNNTGIRYHN